MATTVWYFQ